MEIRRVTQVEAVNAAGHLFDAAPEQQATERFLADDRHADGAPEAGHVVLTWTFDRR